MISPKPFAGRFVFEKRVAGQSKTPRWLATDLTGEREKVIVSLLPRTRAESLAPFVDLAHPHLATVFAVCRPPLPTEEVPSGVRADSWAAVASYVPGRNLQQRLDTAPVPSAKAVQWGARLAEALAEVHARGGAHGAVSPRSIIVSRVEHGIAPVLTHLVAAPAGAYCSPERLKGEPPSELDDVWALHATLFATLTRRAPFAGDGREALAEAIAHGPRPSLNGCDEYDEELERVIARGFASDPSVRCTSAKDLLDSLTEWLSSNNAQGTEIVSLPPPAEAIPDPGDEDDEEHDSPETELDAPGAGSLPGAGAPLPQVAADRPTADSASEASRDGVPYDANPPDAESGSASERGPLSNEDTGDRASPRGTDDDEQSVLDLGAEDAELDAGGAVSLPPPLPPSVAPPAASTAPRASHLPAPQPERSRAPFVIMLGGLLTLGAIVGVVVGGPGDAASGGTASSGNATGATLAPSGSVASAPAAPPQKNPPVMELEAQVTGTDARACIESYMPPKTFSAEEELDFVCSDTDAWLIGRKLYKRIASGGQGGGVELYAHLAWFELSVIATLRAACCADPPPIEAAVPSTPCGSMTELLQKFTPEVDRGRLDEYSEMVKCLRLRQVKAPEHYARVPEKASHAAFDLYFQNIHNLAKLADGDLGLTTPK